MMGRFVTKSLTKNIISTIGTAAWNNWKQALWLKRDTWIFLLGLADQEGEVGALSKLGDLYRHGGAGAVDGPKAEQYYKRASERGDWRATKELADLYKYGSAQLSIEKDTDESWRLYKIYESLRIKHMSPETKMMIVSGSRRSLGETEELFNALQNGAVAVLDSYFLIEYASSGRIIQRRQSLPKEAFLTFEEILQLGLNDIVAVSYMWLTKEHPDPRGDLLRLLARQLKRYNGKQKGIFWDYCSLHQHPDAERNQFRDDEEEGLFQEGLSALGSLYSHPAMYVYMVKDLPPNMKSKKTYYERGWTLTESCWATLSFRRKTLDLLYRNRQALTESDEAAQQRNQSRTYPPLTPDDFKRKLGDCAFTNERDDRALVFRLYRTHFYRYFGQQTSFYFSNMDWDDEEVSQAVRIIAQGAVPQMKVLNLQQNRMTKIGCRAVAAALDNSCPEFCELDLDSNMGIGNKGVRELGPILNQLTVLNLSNCGLDGQGLRTLVRVLCDQAVHHRIRLRELSLGQNNLGGSIRDIAPLAKHLEELSLNDCDANDDDCEMLVFALCGAGMRSRLCRLGLFGSKKIQDRGCRALGRYIRYHSRPEAQKAWLDLRNCHGVGEDSIQMLKGISPHWVIHHIND